MFEKRNGGKQNIPPSKDTVAPLPFGFSVILSAVASSSSVRLPMCQVPERTHFSYLGSIISFRADWGSVTKLQRI